MSDLFKIDRLIDDCIYDENGNKLYIYHMGCYGVDEYFVTENSEIPKFDEFKCSYIMDKYGFTAKYYNSNKNEVFEMKYILHPNFRNYPESANKYIYKYNGKHYILSKNKFYEMYNKNKLEPTIII